ncbi:hypothetical protein ACTWP5_27665 [Streptomyces sp. 4N509B]
MMYAYRLTPTPGDLNVAGWELTENGARLGHHEAFSADHNENLERAADWAESVIGKGRLDWHRVVTDRLHGVQHWEAACSR